MKKILLILMLLLLVITACETLNEGVKDSKSKIEEKVDVSNRVDSSLNNQYWNVLCNEDSTELQKESTLNEMMGKNLTFKGKIVDIHKQESDNIFCKTYYMYVQHCPPKGLVNIVIIVCMKDGQENELLKYQKGDEVIYKTYIDKMSSLLTISGYDGEIIK